MITRFGLLTIRNGVTCCLMIAATALLAVDAIGPGHALLLAGGILYGRWTGRPPVRAGVWDALAVVALLLFPLDLFLVTRHLIGAALRLLTFVVLYRCSNLSEHRDLRQAVALSFVQILAAAASTTEAWFSFYLAAYLFMAIWTLMAMASARDGAPASLRRAPPGLPAAQATALTVAAGSLFFIAIPHFGTGYFQPGSIVRTGGDTLSGFSDRIELGSINRIKKNRAVVMRVRVHGVDDPSFLPLRWRGVALDTFDGRSWSAARSDRRWVRRADDGAFHVGGSLRRGQKTLDQEISMMPLMVPVLFTSPGPTRVVYDGADALGIDEGGALHLSQPPLSRFTYRVLSPAPGHALGGYGLDQDAGRFPLYLALPRVDPRIQALVREVSGRGATDFEKARLIEEHLRSTHAYSVEVDDRGVDDPVAVFLLEGKPGHCEYFAKAMAVMLRYAGIASRVVYGFQSGEWSSLTDTFVVRQSDAHAWVEGWIPGRGWVTFDATPARADTAQEIGLLAQLRGRLDRLEVLWDTWVVGLDLLDQQSLAASVFDGMAGAAVAAAGLFGLIRWSRPWRAARRGRRSVASVSSRARRAAAAFAAFEARWAARGVRRKPGQTAMDLGREVERRGMLPAGEAVAFVSGYYRDRFGR